MCELTITGLAFLWHQIRCIVTILFLVGQGNEKPQVSIHVQNSYKNNCIVNNDINWYELI